MTEQHTYLFTVGGVAFYEHGEYGDEHSLLAKINGEFVVTDFWDRPDSYEVADWLENDYVDDWSCKECGHTGISESEDACPECDSTWEEQND